MQTNSHPGNLITGRASARSQRGKPAAQRFREKYEVTDSGCWIWRGAVDKNGYGIFQKAPRQTVKAHRFALLLDRQEIPAGKLVCHSCDVPSCVNPAHLWVGDGAANQCDASRKGRHAHQRMLVSDVVELRTRVAAGETQAQMTRDYGLSCGYVSLIVSRKKWHHVI